MKNPNHINFRKTDHVHGSYPKVTGSKLRNANTVDESGSITQEVFDRAVDLYLQEKSRVLRYKSLEPSLMKANIQITSEDEDFESDTEFLSDSDFDEQNEFDDQMSIEFKELPKYFGYRYTPPPIKHQYELSIWKTDSYGTIKVKSSYFTPECDRTKKFNFVGLKMDISIDNETLVIYEKVSNHKESLVMLFDIYTLDKIIEDEINTINKLNKTFSENYNEDEDFYRPEDGDFCPTSVNFPKFTSFARGKYILISVGDHAKSK